jgi:hypothetical protein
MLLTTGAKGQPGRALGARGHTVGLAQFLIHDVHRSARGARA